MDKGDKVRFHCLYRDPETAEVAINTTEEYLKIHPNAIDDAFGDLVGQQIQNDMGGLGT